MYMIKELPNKSLSLSLSLSLDLDHIDIILYKILDNKIHLLL